MERAANFLQNIASSLRPACAQAHSFGASIFKHRGLTESFPVVRADVSLQNMLILEVWGLPASDAESENQHEVISF